MAQTVVGYILENIHLINSTRWDDVIEQAKQMEKNQIIVTRIEGDYFCDKSEAEQYYNETYANNGTSV